MYVVKHWFMKCLTFVYKVYCVYFSVKHNVMTTCPTAPIFLAELRLGSVGLCAALDTLPLQLETDVVELDGRPLAAQLGLVRAPHEDGEDNAEDDQEEGRHLHHPD